jgi:uncharacterized damage-inducible protein DinB
MNFDLEKTVEVLSRTPAAISSLVEGLSDEWTQRNKGADTWSAYDVVGHLIHAEESNWLPRVRTILEHGETRVFDPFDRFAMFEASKGKTLEDLLRRFAELRRASLAALERLDLDDEKLSRRGQHPEFGSVELRELLATWVVHDLGHIAQISRVMAYQFADAVGPWKAYLSILRG